MQMPSSRLLFRSFWTLFWVGWVMCLAGNVAAQNAKTKKATPRKSSSKKRVTSRNVRHIGDVVFRLNLGARIFSYNNVTGEFLLKRIGERDVYNALLDLEYGYFYADNLVFFFSLPIDWEVNPIVAGVFSVGIGGGVRYYLLNSFMFVQGQLILTRFSSSNLRFEFGGFSFGAGVSIPIGLRYRLFAYAQSPFNFLPGIQTGLNIRFGFDMLF